jgi:hypothetical protein
LRRLTSSCAVVDRVSGDIDFGRRSKQSERGRVVDRDVISGIDDDVVYHPNLETILEKRGVSISASAILFDLDRERAISPQLQTTWWSASARNGFSPIHNGASRHHLPQCRCPERKEYPIFLGRSGCHIEWRGRGTMRDPSTAAFDPAQSRDPHDWYSALSEDRFTPGTTNWPEGG